MTAAVFVALSEKPMVTEQSRLLKTQNHEKRVS